jgi:prevent-host-death family protein
MREVSLFEAKQKLSALVAEAEAGEIIAITRHGRVVARLGPPTPVRPPDDLPRVLERIIANAKERAARGADRVPATSWDDLEAELEAEDDARFGLDAKTT